ncbi:MAG: phospholipid carrier-dependent glycosyltransferase [Candidatus Andersenbacteria bacterium]
MQVRTHIHRFYVTHKRDILIVIGIFIIAALPRLLDLGSFLTADEKNWMIRSYEFVRAFKDLRFNDMLQTTHPGVTTMWLSGTAIAVKMMIGHVPFSLANIIHFVKAAQFPIALVNALAVPLIYIFLRRLSISQLLAGTAGILIALNPFLIGYSRVAHVDALLASLLVLAALSVIIYAQEGYSRRWLVISGVLSAAAILTKAPAIFIIPFFLLTVLVYENKKIFLKRVLLARSRDLVAWLLMIILLILFTWPALIFVPNPEGNANLIRRDLTIAAVTPHHMAEEYTLNPWHYPAALVTRTTPVTLIFATLAVLYIIWRIAKEGLAGRDSRPVLLLVSFVIFFVLMMTLGAKKGDRYILPVYPVLDILAATALLGIGTMAIKRWRIAPVVPISAAVIYLATVVWQYHPYEIAYSNPIFPDNLSQELGWGEGLDQVGLWLSENHPEAVVASWYPQELQAYTSAQVLDYGAHEHPQNQFVVLYRNMFGRAADHPATEMVEQYYSKRTPVFVAMISGKEYAWVYEQRSYERHVGELTTAVRVGQEIAVEHEQLGGIDVLVPTFSGRADSGVFVAELKDALQGHLLHRWEVPVSNIANDEWMTLPLPQAINRSGQAVFVEIYATGTATGNAPTVRYTSEHKYRNSNMFFSQSGSITDSDVREGNLAIRLRYAVGGVLVSEEESRLLR